MGIINETEAKLFIKFHLAEGDKQAAGAETEWWRSFGESPMSL